MKLDDFQKSWQSQDAVQPISINADLLLQEVRRNQQSFRRKIFWRDVREVGVAGLLIPIFIYGGWKTHWALYLSAVSCFVVGAFMLFDRRRHKKKTPDLHKSLKECASTLHAEVSHQIWLLQNILWWYLLPLAAPILLFFVWITWDGAAPVIGKIVASLLLIGFVGLLYGWIYWLNQAAVKKCLMPRQQELEKLLVEIDPDYKPTPMVSNKPLGPLVIILVVCALAAGAQPILNSSNATRAKPTSELDAIRLKQKHDVPALAVVVAKEGEIVDRAAAGVRKLGDATPVTTNDVFHIGSCTKSMTATLAGILIDEGKLRWDTAIAEVFPELKGKMDKQYEAVTVEQLLHHRGGVPGEPPSAAWKRAWQEIGTPTQQRREFIESVLKAPPEAEPGTKKIYSNQGYTIVGAMLEKITGQDFESLLTERLFKPLHMDTAGFGPPGSKNKVDQPWGHTQRSFKIMAIQADNPSAITPAGRVHCSLDDLARYAMLHLQPTNTLLKPETMARLHAAPKGVEIKGVMDNYACGWVRMKRSWAGGSVLWHNGSNTMWYIVMWLAPEKDFCVIAATNIAGDDAEKACDDACVMMIKKWLPDSK